MAFGDWIVGVFMNFSTNGIATMARLRAGVEGVNDRIKVQNGLLDKNAALMAMQRRRVEELRAAQWKYGTQIAGGIALAGGAAVAYGVAGAADLQRQITAVQIATHNNSRAAFQQYAALALHVSGMTAQDTGTIAKEMAATATSGLNDPRNLASSFTKIAKAADVLWMSPKHLDPVESSVIMSQMAHLFGVYKGQKFDDMLNRAVQMMFVQPEALKSFVTQGRMFMPSAMSAGVSQEDIFKQAMTMGQVGFLKGRGGSGLARVIEYLSGAATMTGHLSKAQHRAMGILGLLGPSGTLDSQYLDSHGNLQLQKVVDHLEQIRKNTAPTAFLGLMQNAFLAQGGRYMSGILVPAVYNKAQENWRRMNEIGGVDKMWSQYSGNFFYQFNVFWTNLQNIFKVLFLPTLPELTRLFKNMGEQLGKAVDWLAAHPDWALRIANGIMLITATASAAFAVGTVAQMLKFLGVISALPNAFAVLVWPIRAFAAGLGLLPGPAWAATSSFGALRAALWAAIPAVAGLAAVATTLSLKGDSGPNQPNDNATPLGPAWIAAQRAKAIRHAIAPGQPGTPLGNRMMDKLIPSSAPTVHVNGPITITLPKGTPKQHVSMIIQQLVALGASSNTGASIPGALTIGGGMAAYT